MRKANKMIHDVSTLISVLHRVHVGHLGTIGTDGYPMVKPLNFVYAEGKIYFHSAREGEKIEHILCDNRVCFEAALPIAYVRGTVADPCKAEYLYQSVIIKGKATIVEDRDEKIVALRHLMEKYQPEGGYGDFPEFKLDITAVIRIDIEEMVGKEDLGTAELTTSALRALQDGSALPIVLTRPAE